MIEHLAAVGQEPLTPDEIDETLRGLLHELAQAVNLLRLARLRAHGARVYEFGPAEVVEIEGAGVFMRRPDGTIIVLRNIEQLSDLFPSRRLVFKARTPARMSQKRLFLRQHGLTDMDRQVVELLALGLTNQEIGERLCLAESTIKNRMSRIFKVFGIQRRSALIASYTDIISNWPSDVSDDAET